MILQLLLYFYMFRHDSAPDPPNKCTYSIWYYSYLFISTGFDMRVHKIHQINTLTVRDVTVITLFRHVSTWQCTKSTKEINLQYMILQLSLYSDMLHDSAPNSPNKCTYIIYYSYLFISTCFDMRVHHIHQINTLKVRDIKVITLLRHVSTWHCTNPPNKCTYSI